MVDDIRKLVDRRPFMPFTIRMSDGQQYPVPSTDHIHFSPRGTRVFVSDDSDDSVAILPVLHVSGVIEQSNGSH